MAAKIEGGQCDFSFGEIDLALKRNDMHPARKAGLRQMINARLLNSGALQNRPGRRALYPVSNGAVRTERLTMSPGNVFDIQFGAGRLQIVNSAGTIVANFTLQGNGAALPWASNTVNSIIYALLNLSIYITFSGMRPQVVTWDGMSSWSIADYAEAITVSGQKRTPFYRISPQNVTMLPSASTGNITLAFNSPIVVAGMVGTRMRYCNRQILLGAVIDTSHINGTVVESLPLSQTLTLSASIGTFNVGDEVIGQTTGAKGIVTSSPSTQDIDTPTSGIEPNVGDSLTGGTSGATGIVTSIRPSGGDRILTVALGSSTAFVSSETLTGPWGSISGFGVSAVAMTVQIIPGDTGTTIYMTAEKFASPSAVATASAVSSGTPQAVTIWDDEVINSFRGFPRSCFVDQFRLGFCDFPALPNGIGWSAINSPTDLYVGANPSDGFFELAPSKVRVYYVVPGPESSEFVLCDRRVYYIPISPTNPLRPGSVQFQILSGDGAAQVQPRLAQEAVLYVNAGQNSLMAVIATGAYNRPFNTKNLCEFHAHLFNNIAAIAAPSADGTFNERYAYVLNGDGSMAVGKYQADSLQGSSPVVGWGPWSGAGAVSWVAAYAADVVFTAAYFGAGVVEILDDTQYLDSALPVNALPTPFAAPPGKGPLWFIPSQTVTLMDQVTRMMGTYQIDASGFIVPQNNGGENLTAASLVAGQPWTMMVEPFCPDASPGQAIGQRMNLRGISQFVVYVINSTGFQMVSLFAGPVTQTSPAPGTVMGTYRVPAWFQGDDATQPPPLREEAQRFRPQGRAFDPRVGIIKDTPGPLLIAELGIEASI